MTTIADNANMATDNADLEITVTMKVSRVAGRKTLRTGNTDHDGGQTSTTEAATANNNTRATIPTALTTNNSNTS